MRSTAKLFFKYVSSNVLGMVGVSCYILADTLFIARGVGETGLTALNLAIPVFSIINGTGLMLGVGGATRFSLSGKKDVFSKILSWTLILSLVYILWGIFLSRQTALFLGADANTVSLTSEYLRILLFFSPAFMLNNLVSSFVRNDMQPRLAMTAMLIGSFTNILLDYVFVFPLGLGMFGAALATGVSPVISLLILSIHFIKKQNSFPFQISTVKLSALKDACALGLPSFITELSLGIVIVVFSFVILRLAGNTGLAAYSIVANIAMVLVAVFNGVSSGCQPILSKACGENNHLQMKNTARLGIYTCELLAVLFLLVLFFFAEPITLLFNSQNSRELTEITVQGIHIYFLSFLFSSFNIFMAAFTAAVDRPKLGFFISASRGFIVILPAAIILAYLFDMVGVWSSIVVTEACVAFFSFFSLRKTL